MVTVSHWPSQDRRFGLQLEFTNVSWKSERSKHLKTISHDLDCLCTTIGLLKNLPHGFAAAKPLHIWVSLVLNVCPGKNTGTTCSFFFISESSSEILYMNRNVVMIIWRSRRCKFKSCLSQHFLVDFSSVRLLWKHFCTCSLFKTLLQFVRWPLGIFAYYPAATRFWSDLSLINIVQLSQMTVHPDISVFQLGWKMRGQEVCICVWRMYCKVMPILE